MNESFIRSVLEDRERDISKFAEARRAEKIIVCSEGSHPEPDNQEQYMFFVRQLRWLLSLYNLFPRSA